MTPVPFFTVGHSTRSLEEFFRLLRSVGIRLVVDVRTVPRSRKNPQFNRYMLSQVVADFQIDYEHVFVGGVLREISRDVLPGVNVFWQNQSFHNYADYAMSDVFRMPLGRLFDLGHRVPTAIMC